jgi:hypothetical protein
MTTIATSATTAKDSFLRFALRLDAVCSGVMGVVGIALAPTLARWSGTTTAFEYALSGFFVVFGLTVFGLSMRKAVRETGIVIAIGNVAYSVATVVFVLSGVMPLTTVGIVLTLATGVYTLVLADLQYLGVRRMRP